MRILQVVTMRQWRGAEVFATQLSDALVARGHEVLVLGLLPAPSESITPVRAAAADLPMPANGKLNLRRVHALQAYTKLFQPHVVQANGSQTLKYSALSKLVSRQRIPLVYRNISVASEWIRGPAHRAWGRWLARSLDYVSSVSDECVRDFIVTYRVPAERQSVMHRGIHVPETVDRGGARMRLMQLAPIPAGASVLAHVGNFSPEKNHSWLVDTFREISEARPGAHLVLMGDGAGRAGVAAQVAQLGLQHRVHLLGLQRDAAELVAAADVFVLPSLIEGLPGVVLEAGAQAVPSVAVDVGGTREAIEQGRTGLIVPPGDRNAFIAAVSALLDDEPRRAAMGAAARRLVQDRFSMARTAAAFEDLYARLVEAHEH